MSRLVVDSSVAIKWFVSEDDSEDALKLRDRHQLVAPDLLVAECVNAFWKMALSAAEGLPYVTSDLSFVRKLRAANFRDAEVLTLAEAAALPA